STLIGAVGGQKRPVARPRTKPLKISIGEGQRKNSTIPRPKAIPPPPFPKKNPPVLPPPISSVIRLLSNDRAATATAPTTPAAGPDNAVRIGNSEARLMSIRPPADWLIPIVARPASPASAVLRRCM